MDKKSNVRITFKLEKKKKNSLLTYFSFPYKRETLGAYLFPFHRSKITMRCYKDMQ